MNFRVISSPLGVKALISAEEAMGTNLQNLNNNGVITMGSGLVFCLLNNNGVKQWGQVLFFNNGNNGVRSCFWTTMGSLTMGSGLVFCLLPTMPTMESDLQNLGIVLK